MMTTRSMLVGVAAVAALAGCASTKTTKAASPAVTTVTVATPAVTAAPTTKAPATTKAPPTTKAPATTVAPAVVFQQAGSGTASTPSFHVNDEWQLAWTYDCAAFSSTGNFIVDISQPPGKQGLNVAANDRGVNQLGANGTGVEHYHYGGTIFLNVNSECKWTVKVTS